MKFRTPLTMITHPYARLTQPPPTPPW